MASAASLLAEGGPEDPDHLFPVNNYGERLNIFIGIQ